MIVISWGDVVGRPRKRIYGKFNIKSQGLYLGSSPIECEYSQDADVVASRRKLLCRRYDNCLTYAASLGWVAFACVVCDVDELVPEGLLVREGNLIDLRLRKNEDRGPKSDDLSDGPKTRNQE